MPFKVKKSGKGFKVFSPKGAKSKKPMSKEKALAQQKAIYANWDGKENSKESNMKITKEEAKKLLETAEAILKEYETYTDPETGVTTDDEGNVVSHGWRGGRHSTNDYNRRYMNYSRRPTPAPLTPPGEDENAAAARIANRIAKNKGQTADQGLINWVLKQRALGKLGGKAPAPAPAATPPTKPQEAKPSSPEEAQKLAQEYSDKWGKFNKNGDMKKNQFELALSDPEFYMQYGPYTGNEKNVRAFIQQKGIKETDTILENEVKAELLETATKLLQEATKKLQSRK